MIKIEPAYLKKEDNKRYQGPEFLSVMPRERVSFNLEHFYDHERLKIRGL